MLSKDNKNIFGFTLIELLVVISIIGVLASLSLMSYGTAQKQIRDAQRASDLNQYRNALQNFAVASAGRYPVQIEAYETIKFCETNGDLKNYLSECPTDPIPERSYWYISTANGLEYALYADIESGYWRKLSSDGDVEKTEDDEDEVEGLPSGKEESSFLGLGKNKTTPTPTTKLTPIPTIVSMPKPTNVGVGSSSISIPTPIPTQTQSLTPVPCPTYICPSGIDCTYLYDTSTSGADLTGTDGSFCHDSDYSFPGDHIGIVVRTKGSCQDNMGTYWDYCSYPNAPAVQEYYCLLKKATCRMTGAFVYSHAYCQKSGYNIGSYGNAVCQDGKMITLSCPSGWYACGTDGKCQPSSESNPYAVCSNTCSDCLAKDCLNAVPHSLQCVP